ncbi:Formate nitrite transporter [Hondaea fermentalgiana]|uniref:Formate nitrite transporter n=1 Tax=Hondaea fermentalgiana TaxID=2315210 RepID=A0A2R5GUB1_9STRA|nr:Formate nitrite transporter [Hondaea fermentalgiana]|eukprot:GBG34457.1 Formate nitrite transporter [Hondaea fermentalgiana]
MTVGMFFLAQAGRRGAVYGHKPLAAASVSARITPANRQWRQALAPISSTTTSSYVVDATVTGSSALGNEDDTPAARVAGLDGALHGINFSSEVHANLAHFGARNIGDLTMLSESELQAAGLNVVDSRKLLEAAAAAVTPAAAVPSKEIADSAKAAAPLSLGQSTMAYINDMGLTRAERPDSQIFLSSLMAGGFLSWGAALYVLLGGGSAEMLASAPGLHKVLAASIFPMGLTAITLTGSDLLTSNMLYGAMPFISGDQRRTEEEKSKNLTRLWGISLAGNFVSCAAMAAFVAPVILATPAAAAFAKGVAIKKTSGAFVATFGKAVGANWLVNLAIFQAATAQTSTAKMAALWVPVTAFVALGLEHSVANMFLVPLGVLCGADIPLQTFFLDNLLPVLAGNAVGASICVGWLQWHALMPPKYVPGSRQDK